MAKVSGKPGIYEQLDLFGGASQSSARPGQQPEKPGKEETNGKAKQGANDQDVDAAGGASGDGDGDGGIVVPDSGGRTLEFSISGEPGARITVRELGDGTLAFTVAVDTESGAIADLRGLFFQVSDESLLDGLTVSGADVTDSAAAADAVSSLGNGANVSGGNHGPFDFGVEIGTQGMGADDIQSTTFVLSHQSIGLTLDLIAGQDFAVRLTSVGPLSDEEGGREDSLKLVGTAPAPNEAPDAADDAVATDEDTALIGNVLVDNGYGPDGDPDGDSLTVNATPVTGPEHGTLVMEEDGSFTYTPDDDFYGEDKFVYEVSDGHGGTDTATVTVAVVPVNDDPIAENDRLVVIETESTGYVGSLDVVANDHDVDNGNDELFVSAINGTPIQPGGWVDLGFEAFVVLGDDGRTVFYEDPDSSGPFDFEYTLSDGAGGEATGLVEVGFVDDPLIA